MSAQNEIRVERIGLATLYLADCMEVLPTLGRPVARDLLQAIERAA